MTLLTTTAANPAGNIDDVTDFTQLMRERLVKSCLDEDDLPIEEDRDLLLSTLNSMDRTIAAKTKLSNDVDAEEAGARDRAAVLDSIKLIGQSNGLKDLFVSGTDDVIESTGEVLKLGDGDTMDIGAEVMSMSKGFESLKDFDARFGDAHRESLSK